MLGVQLTVVAAFLAAVLVSPSSAAQEPAPKITIEIEFATTEPLRDIALWTAAGEAANRGADLALDRAFRIGKGRGGAKVAGRLAQMWLVSMPLASFTQVGAHDSGHFARADDIAPGRHIRDVTHWPWPVPLVGTVEYTPEFDLAHTLETSPYGDLAVLGGGEQAALALRRRLIDRAYTSNAIGYFDATLLAYATLDFPFYAWTDLRPSHLTSEAAFYSGEMGDFRQYVLAQAAASLPRGRGPRLADLDRFARQIRRSAWLNLGDTSLWFALERSARYIGTGERTGQLRRPHIGRLPFAAGAYSTLGSTGLERGVDLRLLHPSFVTRLTVRHIAVPDDGNRWGGAVAVLPTERDGLRPMGQVDLWKRLDHSTAARVEVGARRRFAWRGQPFDTGVRAGYKSDGYLPDAPAGRGALLSLFTTVRF